MNRMYSAVPDDRRMADALLREVQEDENDKKDAEEEDEDEDKEEKGYSE